jgi:Putative phage serine protease XkdF
MSLRNVSTAMHRDPAVRHALESVFGKSDEDLLAEVISKPIPTLVSKGTMLAAPKALKMLVARPKPPPAPSIPRLAPRLATPMAPKVPKVPGVPGVAKSDETSFGIECTIAKFDEDQKTVFGWASITEVDGEPVVDRQGDMIESEEMAKAAYDYVIMSRKGGHQHKRSDDDQVLQVSDMIESMVFTPEKIAKMGLPPETPKGWWVGYKVNDDEIWKAVKAGEITGLSIHGKGRRIPVS